MKLPLIPFEAPVWRLLPVSLANTPAAPASAPQGRFHHDWQVAAYASLSAEGTAVAMARYQTDDTDRVLIAMWLTADKVADARGIPSASIVWQDIVSRGYPSPTWALSDAARGAGAQAMLYNSRSRPELAHIVVFAPSCLRRLEPPSDQGAPDRR